ncbi:MAG: PilW family protein [Comamonadaceae bacterium]|nr:PilW family protein [Comamonadaceae bacterium]
MKCAVSRARMRGLSLVEVMVSLVIGMVVVGAVLVSYLSSGKSSRQQSAYADMHENAQMAMTLLSRDLLLAGYAQVSGIQTVGVPPVSTFTRTYSGRAVFGCDKGFVAPSTTGTVACVTTAGKPAIEVVYEADEINTVPSGSPTGPSDCKGTKITPAAGTLSGVDYFITYNRFYLATGASGRSELYCASAMGGAEPLVENVDDMKIWYGEAASAATSRQIVRYVMAADVTDWQLIVSVRVCLLMRSSEPVLDMELYPDPLQPPKYLDCDSTEQTITDRFLRRAYFTTTTLRNKMAF